MTALSNLQQHLDRYWALPYHNNAELKAKLDEVQDWQRDRIRSSHQALFNEPNNKMMASYFLTQLYGGDDFKVLATQLGRVIPKAKKVEKMAKESALETGSLAIQAAILAIELDLDLATYLLDNNLEVNQKNMLAAYRAVDKAEARRNQINNLKDVCYKTDKHLNSFILKKAFALTKGAAYSRGYQPLYDFIDAGFAAIKPLKSVGSFIEPFCDGELKIIDNVHNQSLTENQVFDML